MIMWRRIVRLERDDNLRVERSQPALLEVIPRAEPEPVDAGLED